jgi:DinB family protein
MKRFAMMLLFSVFTLACTVPVHAQTTEPTTGRSGGQVVDFILDIQERRVVEMAEVMPAGKYSFAPSGKGFQGVRTFAEQLRHIAADNYLLGAGMLGEKPPVDVGRGEDGSDAVRTKSEVIDYLKGSFTYMHRAVRSIDDENIPIPTPPISPWPKGTATRLGVALEDCVHTWDHYGQLVEYLRMNGIVPPESRK